MKVLLLAILALVMGCASKGTRLALKDEVDPVSVKEAALAGVRHLAALEAALKGDWSVVTVSHVFTDPPEVRMMAGIELRRDGDRSTVVWFSKVGFAEGVHESRHPEEEVHNVKEMVAKISAFFGSATHEESLREHVRTLKARGAEEQLDRLIARHEQWIAVSVKGKDGVVEFKDEFREKESEGADALGKWLYDYEKVWRAKGAKKE
jgi:hypothetical protein